ncbi:MAG: hypothetical protein ACOCP8_02335 [archaeon]
MFYKAYGTKFIIKMAKKRNIKVNFLKEKIVRSGLQYYTMFVENDIESQPYKVFKINFIDSTTAELNNNSYIATIAKSTTIAGSEALKLALKINDYLGVEKTFLTDDAIIECYDGFSKRISLVKLFERGHTFYTKYGFEFDTSSESKYTTYFKSSKDVEKYVIELYSKCLKIKVGDLKTTIDKIIEEIGKSLKNGNDTVKIKKTSIYIEKTPNSVYNSWVETNPISLYEILERMCGINYILNNFKRTDKIGDVLIALFNIKDDCRYYENIYNILTRVHTTYIINGVEIKMDFAIPFIHLDDIIMTIPLSYTFKDRKK